MKKCPECNFETINGQILSGHMSGHRRPFESLRTDGSRRDRLIRENGRHCEICKNTMWIGQLIPLTIDHIDGNADNNLRENLRVLCPNCHAQTPTYCGRNVGKFPSAQRRQSRGKYYLPHKRLHSSMELEHTATNGEVIGSNPIGGTN